MEQLAIPLEFGVLGGRWDNKGRPTDANILTEAVEGACRKYGEPLRDGERIGCTFMKPTNRDEGYMIPDCMSLPELSDKKKTLYVNAWDPHSAVGNGNSMDRSLDGFFGRTTAMGPLCHPFTNKHLRNEHNYFAPTPYTF
jgi:hypothetical protein